MSYILDLIMLLGHDLLSVSALFVSCTTFFLCDAFIKSLYIEDTLSYSTNDPNALVQLKQRKQSTQKKMAMNYLIAVLVSLMTGMLLFALV